MSPEEPITARPTTSSSLSRTACERCRRQKLRCSRQRPTCARCSRLPIACTYPQPPDRKLLAARRSVAHARAENTLPESDATQSNFEPGPMGSSETVISEDRSIEAPSETQTNNGTVNPVQAVHVAHPVFPSPDLGELPPRAIGLALLDIYFERIYNANLLFHRARLFEFYLDWAVPSYLLRAIFSLSSLFLQKTLHAHRLRSFAPTAELVALASYAINGPAWAESARREVLLLADRPAVETVQALSCLNLYWFSRGDMDRARMSVVIAFTACSNLGPLDFHDYGIEDKDEILLKERKQGCFWACWASMCVSALPDAYARNAWEEARKIPLPLAPNEIIVDGGLSRLYYMDRDWSCQPRSPSPTYSQAQNDPSIMAEHMKLMGVWARIQILSRTRQDELDVVEIENLSNLAKSIYESSHFPPYTTGSDTMIKDHARLLGLHSLYHLCQIVVLCPLVSLFSGRQVIPGDSEDQTRATAETVTKHAIRHGQLIRDYTSKSKDISKVSPLVGFASFVATSIFLALLRAQARRHRDNQEEPAPVSHSLLGLIHDTIDMLSILQTFWKPLEPMVKKLQYAAEQILEPGDGVRNNSSLAESQVIEVPLVGVNSPAREEDVITTTYIDSPDYRIAKKSGNLDRNSHSEEVDRRYEVSGEDPSQRVVWQQQTDLFDWCATEGILDISEELLDLDSVVEWDMDLLSAFPAQGA